MAFYDDGGVSYAEEQLKKARERRDVEAKKQEKFSKRLQLLNLGITGANFFLNQKADKLETEGILARSNYLTANENSKNFNAEMQEYINDGYNNQQILQFRTKDKLNGYLSETYGEDYDLSQFSDAVNKISRDFSQDPKNLESFNKVVEAQSKIPGLSQEEMIELIKREDMPPRDIASFLGNKVLKVFKSHDEETLSAEDKLEKQKSLGGLIGKRFEDSRVALQEYAALGNPIDELVEFLKSEEGSQLTVFKDVEKQIFQQAVQDKYGNSRQVTFIQNVATGPNGEAIPIGRPVETTASSIEAPIKPFTASQIQIESDNIIGLANRDIDLQDALQPYIFKDKQGQRLSSGFVNNVLMTKDNLIKNYDLDPAQASVIATKFIAGQDNYIIDTNPSLFDMDVMKGSFNTDNINQYVESIIKTKPKNGLSYELTNLRDNIQEGILGDEGLDEQEKELEISKLNNIMENYDILPAKEYNQIPIEKADISQDEKDFLTELNEVPYIGKVSEFMFGESLDIVDATWLIPGYGLFKIGGKVISKTTAPIITRQVINSKASQEFIKKAGLQIQKGFKNQNTKDMFIKNLTPVQKAIFNSMNKKGNVNMDTFTKELFSIPGVYIKGYMPSITQTVGWGLGGTVFIYAQSQQQD